ncbi:hypothetical protein B9Z19DRAFT_1063108 [Tuber borchii]|uniref:MARVEL domain-containing protein n=1 Tax=Tuber borchii TaxID=42251 RepID=A0A2T6ZZM5_TUBBO|nr:hypothetical protein B9Z19DRAFT_1063108 [Tuber borchii]
MRDSRWGTTPLLLLRISQLLLGVVVLGIAAYFASKYSGWYIAFTVALGFVTLVWTAVVLGLFFKNKLSPPLVMFVDVPLAVAYILSVATVAANWPRALGGSCVAKVAGVPGESILDADCATLKGAFGILIIEMLTFHGAIIWDAIVMSRNPNRRRDVRGVAQNYVPVMPKPMAVVDSGGPHGQYQLDGTLVYPAELASPAAQYNSDMPPTDPQQQQQYQQYQQSRGPPQELSGTG